MTACSVKIGMDNRIRPDGSIRPETPVLAARAKAIRFSTARNTTIAKCWWGADEAPNQASLVIVAIRVAPSATNSRTRSGKMTS
ncbi:MAG: hypothetical protein A3K11_13400 [Nitrospirae bacterium RIFCSPLOWO2_12_FULL_63_8]|nr:MAG: hypothetical protein A3K11_13400 [Nitrospirae bacterium RIFCSPLOWO2_12_FULL_63_8]